MIFIVDVLVFDRASEQCVACLTQSHELDKKRTVRVVWCSGKRAAQDTITPDRLGEIVSKGSRGECDNNCGRRSSNLVGRPHLAAGCTDVPSVHSRSNMHIAEVHALKEDVPEALHSKDNVRDEAVRSALFDSSQVTA